MKILIVEDEDLAVKKIQKTLSEVDGDAEVIGVTDSIQSTVNWLEQNNAPDLILMDVVMPGLSGFQATRALAKDDETKHIPVIICTTKGQETDRIWGLRQGAKDYIVKPLEQAELLKKIVALG